MYHIQTYYICKRHRQPGWKWLSLRLTPLQVIISLLSSYPCYLYTPPILEGFCPVWYAIRDPGSNVKKVLSNGVQSPLILWWIRIRQGGLQCKLDHQFILSWAEECEWGSSLIYLLQLGFNLKIMTWQIIPHAEDLPLCLWCGCGSWSHIPYTCFATAGHMWLQGAPPVT